MEERVVDWQGLMCEAFSVSQGVIELEQFDIIHFTGKSADFGYKKNQELQIMTELERAKDFLLRGQGVFVNGEVLYLKGLTSIDQSNFIHALKSFKQSLTHKETMLYKMLVNKYHYLAVKSRLKLFEMGIFNDEEMNEYLSAHISSEDVQNLLHIWIEQKVAS